MDTSFFSSIDDAYFDEDIIECIDHEVQEEFNAPPTDDWIDAPCHDPSKFPTKVTIDEAKNKQWEMAQIEINHLKKRVKHLIGNGDDVTKQDIVDHFLGTKSKFALFMYEQLNMDTETYLCFMSTFSLQSIYKTSPSAMYSEFSDIRHAAKMGFDDYCKIWKSIATLKKVEKGTFISNSRRDKCLWQGVEEIVNNLCKSVSCEDRHGSISIALDDDKFDAHMSGENIRDTFGLKYVTHVRRNRKGMVAHSAVTSGVNIPLGISFERLNDTSSICFKRILNNLFGNGAGDSANLRGVLVHSDRDYMVPSNVFDYLASCKADFVGTTKRSAQCWPFTFNQKQRDGDLRTHLETAGTPSLFVKYVVKHGKLFSASAFRNGSDAISTAVSSIHRGHHWEGIALNQRQAKAYSRNPEYLRLNYFSRINEPKEIYDVNISEEEKALMAGLESKVDFITLDQG